VNCKLKAGGRRPPVCTIHNRPPAFTERWKSHRSYTALELAQAIGIECMGQENADADEGKERCYDLNHSLPPKVEMPGRARFKNSR